jgi:hypothetical protein
MFAPSLDLQPSYEDLLLNSGYPFSVVPDHSLTRNHFFTIMRDTYQGTEFDLSKQPSAGPFGWTDRYDGANGCAVSSGEKVENGAFERPISVYRMAYSFVGEPTSSVFRQVVEEEIAEEKKEEGVEEIEEVEEVEEVVEVHQQKLESESPFQQHLLHFAPHVSQTAMYFPILVSPSSENDVVVPSVLCRGTVKNIDRLAAYWVFRIVKHTARGLVWNRCLEQIQRRQSSWENKVSKLIRSSCLDSSLTDIRALFEIFANKVVADWWVLNDEMLLRFGDGWEHEWVEHEEAGEAGEAGDTSSCQCRPIAYPRNWLEKHNFFRDNGGGDDDDDDKSEQRSTSCASSSAQSSPLPPPPPTTKLWTRDAKIFERRKSKV